MRLNERITRETTEIDHTDGGEHKAYTQWRIYQHKTTEDDNIEQQQQKFIKPTFIQNRKCAFFHWQMQIKPVYDYTILKCTCICIHFSDKFLPIFAPIKNARIGI